jgi:hypothetical protein
LNTFGKIEPLILGDTNGRLIKGMKVLVKIFGQTLEHPVNIQQRFHIKKLWVKKFRRSFVVL